AFQVASYLVETRATDLHAVVDRPLAPLWGNPHDILRGVLDVAGFAMHTVLRIDLQAVFTVVVFNKFVYRRRAIARLGSGVLGQVDRHRNGRVFQGQVNGFVFFVVGV